MTDDSHPSAGARSLLTDAFGRVHQLVPGVVEGPEALLRFRADADANTIAWLVWQTARQQDAQVAAAAGADQAWTADGWVDRFRGGLGADDTGYGDSTEQVARLDHATAELLTGYHEAVQVRTRTFLDRLDAAELDRVLDDSYEPPVTVAARLVSIVADALQHLGQAAYVRSLAERSLSSSRSGSGEGGSDRALNS